MAEPKWFQFRARMMSWQKKRNEDELALAERAKEHAIGILRKRYGYTREQAASELHRHYSKARLD